MNQILINKKSKRINVQIEHFVDDGVSNVKIITKGPLGEISYNITNNMSLVNNKLFIKKNNLNFLLKKISKLIKSVSTG